MAIIDKDTRMTVATRLANLNYKEQMDSSLAKLNELFEKYIIGKTPERLKNEFPEAYLIYMDVITADWNEKRDDAKKPASNLCDTIENIRATLKPNLKEALKHDKEEE